MSMFESDGWRLGIIQAPITQVAHQPGLDEADIHWINASRPLCFLADPFGLWLDNRLYLFAEAYDYRTRMGRIVVYVLDAQLNILETGTVLEEAWHLSYPVVFEQDGDIWMMPEGYKSGRLNLYRAIEFPWRWQRVEDFDFPTAAIDASLWRNQDGWWIFYTPPFPKEARTSALMLAHAPSLHGPWRNVTDQPIRIDKSGARMGGTPFIDGDRLVLPTQDCSQCYGGAITLLSTSLEHLERPQFEVHGTLTAPASAGLWQDGLHTLSAVDDRFTLIDSNRMIKSSLRRIGIDIRRALGKATRPRSLNG